MAVALGHNDNTKVDEVIIMAEMDGRKGKRPAPTDSSNIQRIPGDSGGLLFDSGGEIVGKLLGTPGVDRGSSNVLSHLRTAGVEAFINDSIAGSKAAGQEVVFRGKARSFDDALKAVEDSLGERIGGTSGGVNGTHFFSKAGGPLTFRWIENAEFARSPGLPEIRLPSDFVFEKEKAV